MSAVLLRRAATALREAANAATPGNRLVVNSNEGGSYSPFWQVVNDAFLQPPENENEPWLAIELHTGVEADAHYVALMYPPVALAMAAWLEAIADETDSLTEYDGLQPALNIAGWVEACTTARTILCEVA